MTFGNTETIMVDMRKWDIRKNGSQVYLPGRRWNLRRGIRTSDQVKSLQPDGYLARVVDAQVERYLRVFGAVEIAGAKWCGKTWTALAHAASVSYVDEMLALARDDPSAMLIGDQPHVVDEWQRVPAIWDTVRHEVDRTRGLRGAWILTGSSTPLTKDVASGGPALAHSGAGRIGRVRMRPMSLQESGDSTGGVSLAGLFRGEFMAVLTGVSELAHEVELGIYAIPIRCLGA